MAMRTGTSKWPKVLPPLTDEQRRINDEFLKLWHEVLPRRFGIVERFNHGFPVWNSPRDFTTTLEIGAGLGEHIRHERLTPAQEAGYHALEIRPPMADEIRGRFPRVSTIVGDCQGHLEFPDGTFDRVIAVHVLEHLPDLPACLREVYRLVNRSKGVFLAVIPTEGGPAYSLARILSAARIYRRHFGGDYSWIPKREHINRPVEIMEELAPYFTVERRRFFPFPFLPAVACNLCIGLALKPRPEPVAG
jgi:SAM-dependent methyltransferase